MPWVEGEALTPTNLNAIMGSTYQVLDPVFGTIGNGIADDTSSVQSALNTAAANNAGAAYRSGNTTYRFIAAATAL